MKVARLMANTLTREEVLQRALLLACDRIADGPQQYHEVNTPDGWADVFTEAAERGVTTDEVLASRAEPRKMTDAERADRDIPAQ